MIHRVGLLDFLQARMEGAEHARRRYEVAAREDRGVDETPTRLRRRLAGRQSSTRSLKARSRQLITNSLFRPILSWRDDTICCTESEESATSLLFEAELAALCGGLRCRTASTPQERHT